MAKTITYDEAKDTVKAMRESERMAEVQRRSKSKSRSPPRDAPTSADDDAGPSGPVKGVRRRFPDEDDDNNDDPSLKKGEKILKRMQSIPTLHGQWEFMVSEGLEHFVTDADKIIVNKQDFKRQMVEVRRRALQAREAEKGLEESVAE